MYVLLSERDHSGLAMSQQLQQKCKFHIKLILEPGCRNTSIKQSWKQPLGFLEGALNTCYHSRFSMLNNIDYYPNWVGWFCLLLPYLYILGQGHWTSRASCICMYVHVHTHAADSCIPHHRPRWWRPYSFKTAVVSYWHGWLLKKT